MRTKLSFLAEASLALEKQYGVDEEIAPLLVELYARLHPIWGMTADEVAEEVWESGRLVAANYDTTKNRGDVTCQTRIPMGRASRRHP
jgi:hypothetical protein